MTSAIFTPLLEEPSTSFSLRETWSHLLQTLSDIWIDTVAHVPAMVVGCVVLFVTWAVARWGTGLLESYLDRRSLRRSMRDLILRFALLAVWVLGLMVTAMLFFPGLTPTKALGVLGLGSVAIGFAFKDVFENFLAGVMILWRFPFEIGDTISCEGIVGRVDRITIRNTLLELPTGETVIVPNSTLFKNAVRVLTEEPRRRVHVTVGVGYGEDVDRAIDEIEAALSSCETVASDPAPQVFAQAFGASSIDIDVAWWCDSTLLGERRSRGEVVRSVKAALDRANIEIPFPHRTLTFSEPLHVARRDAEDRDEVEDDRPARQARAS